MKKHSYIEYRCIVYNINSGVHHPRGERLITVLNDAGMGGWIVCGMVRDDKGDTDVYLYQKVIVEEV
ncbi:MAG TPA: hypothetical protein ENI23_09240 [bacterium]|nr:hypothetical protein [bacterium]